MTIHPLRTAAPIAAFTVATFALAAGALATGGSTSSCFQTATQAADAVEDGYGLRSPDAIERWTTTVGTTRVVLHRPANTAERWRPC